MEKAGNELDAFPAFFLRQQNPVAVRLRYFDKSKTLQALILQGFDGRSGGIPLRAATDMVATPHCGARFLSVEKGFDEISATGGHRILSPRPYRPRVRILASTCKIPDTRKGHPGFCVEVAGFEPAAFWSRTKRATKLRYTSKLEPMRGLEPLTC